MTAVRITEAVTNVEGAAVILDQELLDVDGLQLGFMCDALARLRDARPGLQRCEAALERAVADLMRTARTTRTEVPGVGVVETKRGTDRKQWDHQALAKAWLEAYLSTLGGEIPKPWDVRDALLDVAALAYWRAGALRKLAIDPDEYCEAIPGHTRVIITGATP
ncbi:MAG: hypothetical protein ACRDT6_09550 [Micromonosporaceae bacterium]